MVEDRECYGQYDIRYYNFEDLSRVRLTGVKWENETHTRRVAI